MNWGVPGAPRSPVGRVGVTDPVAAFKSLVFHSEAGCHRKMLGRGGPGPGSPALCLEIGCRRTRAAAGGQ